MSSNSSSSAANASRRLFAQLRVEDDEAVMMASPPKTPNYLEDNGGRYDEDDDSIGRMQLFNPLEGEEEDEPPSDYEQQSEETDEERRRREEEESLALARAMQAEEALQAHHQFMQSLHSMDLSDEDRAAMQAALEEDEREEVAEFEDEDGELSYDAMLRLGERIGDVRSERWATVAQKHIDRLPVEVYDASSSTERRDGVQNDSEIKCLVCQHEYVDKERLRHLPCGHCFHAECVDEWLKTRDNCLYCRKSIVENESDH